MNMSAVMSKTVAQGSLLLVGAAVAFAPFSGFNPLIANAATCTTGNSTLVASITLDANNDTIASGTLNGKFHHAPTNNPKVVNMAAGNALLVYKGGAWNAWGQLSNQPAQPWLTTTHVRTTQNGNATQHEFPNNNFYSTAGEAQAANAGYSTVIPTDGTLRIYIADSVLLNTGNVSWDVYSCATATPTPTVAPTATPTPTATPVPACQNGVDDDSDGLIDMADPGCSSPADNNEGDGTSQCQDGIDNDGDGAADFPNDFSCSSRQDNDETMPKAQCQDGIDNDNDGLVDVGRDPGCANNQDNDESNAAAATPTPTPTATPTATPTPEPGSASFKVTKSDGQDIVRPGQSLTYTIKIKNTGDVEISDLELIDTVPNHLAITKVTPSALTKSGQMVKWAGIHLNEGETKEFTITATVKNSTPDNTVIKNTARVESDDFDKQEAATDSTTVKKPKVVVISGPAIAGATHVPVTAKTGAGSVAGALMSMIAGGGLMFARKRLV